MQRTVIKIVQFGAANTLARESENLVESLNDDEVLIESHYSGLNFADIIMRLGFYQDAPKKPFVPGYEVSGKVLAVGKNVTRLREGDEVLAGTRFGGYASHVKVPANFCFKTPAHLDLSASAALPVNYITAHIALNEFLRVRAGDRILLEGASGGVGVVAMQMAKAAGAEVVGLTTSPHKKEFIQKYGAQAITVDEFEKDKSIRDFDFILNSSGGSSMKLQYGRLAKSGQIVCIGVQSGIKEGKRSVFNILKTVVQMPKFGVIPLMMASRAVGGFNALKYFDDERAMAKILPSIEKTQVTPHVGEVFSAEDVASAHFALENKKAVGKVLLKWQ